MSETFTTKESSHSATGGDTAATATRRADAEGVDGGVGLTALLVAAARAIETHRHDSLAQDVHAEHFVRAAPASADWPVRIGQVPEGDDNPLWGRFARYFGLRTRVLDDFVLGSVLDGSRQVVLLGAGLDTRAFRLDLPSDCVVFEIDRAGVLAFKHQVLTDLSAAPRVKRVPVPVDLRADWVTALTTAGFDPAAPSVWLAEGLLFYLPSPAETYLIDTVDRLTTVGSAPWSSPPCRWRASTGTVSSGRTTGPPSSSSGTS
ncbi:SAM-dependent methyltransferase, partial [Streptomyces sp. NPDC056639]|uniref:SAM-dependent methyltransferase n=1 Tax=Streptomyces sp. NPDC056639 TaxID=3345888 RepID=UPI0036B5B8CF